MSLVSVLIPVYNVEGYVGRCLESLSNQTFKDFDVVIVDDGCTDSSITVVKGFCKRHPDISVRILAHEHNMGLLMARRTAYIQAEGKYMVFLDSDDYLLANSLEVLVNGIESSGADIYVGSMVKAYSDGRTSPVNIGEGIFSSADFLKLLLLKKIPHSLCAKIFKRELFDDCSTLPAFMNQINSEDMILFYTLVLRCTTIVVANEPVYAYFYNSLSSSKKTFATKQFSQIVRATNYIYRMLGEKNGFEDLTKRMLYVRLLSILAQGCPSSITNELDPGFISALSIKDMHKSIGLSKSVLLKMLWEMPFLRKITKLYYTLL